ncbi:Group II intron, maturase-specific domain [Caballeronia terrestris]|uniref:Group II intron, maturase-specific domain n=2 Tax=Caballeronia terrestris TaxID=1226301 RepID=A0A158L5H7_9BURK|nr:Group II intron, maturase-specific domain [Caballeronia terrestris]
MPAKKNVQAFLDKVKAVLRKVRTAKQEVVIRSLNPLIRGWANYHCNQVAKEIFHKVDMVIWKLLWRWARRRHPNKSGTWTKERYFLRHGSRTWVFGTKVLGENGKESVVKLVRASDTPIRRHAKIKGEANLFDLAWEQYFEDRLTRSMKDKLQGRTRLLNLWVGQDGVCPNCQEPLTRETGWHVHHIVPRALGGSDSLSNLLLLHPNCHRQTHSLGNSGLPAPLKRGFAEA